MLSLRPPPPPPQQKKNKTKQKKKTYMEVLQQTQISQNKRDLHSCCGFGEVHEVLFFICVSTHSTVNSIFYIHLKFKCPTDSSLYKCLTLYFVISVHSLTLYMRLLSALKLLTLCDPLTSSDVKLAIQGTELSMSSLSEISSCY